MVLIREAFEHNKVYNVLRHVSDGVEAIAFLRGEGEYEGAPRPDLILLDLNLPRKDGREVLAEIKEDPELRTIPVVVLTTSEAEEDIAALLRPARQRLRDQAGRLRPLHRGRAPDRRLLRLGGQAPEPAVTAFRLLSDAPPYGGLQPDPTKERLVRSKVIAGVLTTVAVLAAMASPALGANRRFSARVTNAYYPLLPGMRWEYRGVKDGRPLRDVVRREATAPSASGACGAPSWSTASTSTAGSSSRPSTGSPRTAQAPSGTSGRRPGSSIATAA